MVVHWRIGTSGWNYKHWKGLFYPKEIPVSRWLDYYTKVFDTVEVNATFYRLPGAETFEKWYENTPRGFLWAVKANRYITHTKRLLDCREALDRFYDRVKRLQEKLGPILCQLPPSLKYDETRFRDFCRLLDPDYRYAFEVRHPSWINREFFQILKDHNMALCISDTAGRYPFSEEITADFTYIRLHGSRKLYASSYSEKELKEWERKIRKWGLETYLYFDNDFEGYAVDNARTLKEVLLGAPDGEENAQTS